MGSQRFGQLVKEKEIKREVISGGEKEKKVRKSKGEEQRKEKIKNIYNNHILIINKRLIRKVYQIHKSYRFFSDCVCLSEHLFLNFFLKFLVLF